jgi:NAD(P)-dependent dehydrogenase (short-subunit alcohol dehydrogenase family)
MLVPSGRVAMVSGASRGIGRKVVERLLASGFHVSAGLRDPRVLPAAERLDAQPYDADDPASPRDWVAACIARFGRIDALVNVAGINNAFQVEDEDESALDALWAINVKAPLRLIRHALPHLRRAGEGRVVNLASLSGKRVRNANAGYAMSKFALVALTHAVRHAGWDDGVRATALCPGFVMSDMTMKVTKIPRHGMTDPADVAVLVETLLLLPRTASIAELLVNCQHEDAL